MKKKEAISLYDLKREPIIIDPVFEQEKKKLRELYKLFKAGLIMPTDIGVKEKRLLRKYYNMDVFKY